MRQVETTLEDVQNSTVNLSSQITRVNRNAINDQPYKGSKGGEETRLYSLEKEFIESSEIPRWFYLHGEVAHLLLLVWVPIWNYEL